MKSIFVFAYYSYNDPVFQSAVLPYLKTASREQLRFVVLTWEQDQFKMTKRERDETRDLLAAENIFWYDTKWHSGRLKVLKKGFDLLKGIFVSSFLIAKYKTENIFSEGFPGAVIGHFLSKIHGIPHLVHTFEPHADYMADAGVWTKAAWEYKLLKKLEGTIARHAKYVITGTEAYKAILLTCLAARKVVVIPSCIDTAHYNFNVAERKRIRLALGLKTDQTVIVYLGKLGGMYMDRELFDFFKHCLSLDEGCFFFLFTNETTDIVDDRLKEFGIPTENVLVKFLNKTEMPAYLSAADIGFCGIRPIRSRRFSSPIKNGEYWACGLPVLIPKGISDDYLLATEENLGFSFDKIEEINLTTIQRLKALDRSIIAQKGTIFRGIRQHQQQILDIFRD